MLILTDITQLLFPHPKSLPHKEGGTSRGRALPFRHSGGRGHYVAPKIIGALSRACVANARTIQNSPVLEFTNPMKRSWIVVTLTALLAASSYIFFNTHTTSAAPEFAQNATATPIPGYEGKITAPEFPANLEWLNVADPLTLGSLRGKIVLLDFWTYGCINCIHIMPDLKQLEDEFKDELVVVGIHSAKFKNEGRTENIREIVQRYGITHPVLNDYDFDVWDLYGAQAWPTLFLIDPAGKIVGRYAGEGVYQVFAPILRPMIVQWDARKGIDRRPFQTRPEAARPATPLAYPGKVLADAAGKRLFISDTNNNRIVVADLATYEVQTIIGSGTAGLKDGPLAAAQFNRPQGVALSGSTLYIADTENHAIRAVDLNAGKVTTLAGTGQQALKRNMGGPALTTQLNSPWDVVAVGDVLYIAMAGNHQLWALDLRAGSIAPFAGSGKEGLIDGALKTAQFAQPSGIVSDGKRLYFTDPESSAIRAADVDPNGVVQTFVGTGLFNFGDIDGAFDAVLLQHALGVTLAPDGVLYIADTYNHKIKLLDPAQKTVKTLFGKAEPGYADGKDAAFNEPGGLSYADSKLYIADTNNSVIRVADLTSGTVSTVVFPNADVLALTPDASGEPITLPAQTVAPGTTQIIVNISVPAAFKFNDIAPFELHFAPDALAIFGSADLEILKPTMPLTIPVTLKEGQSALHADADVYYCDAVNERLCYISRLSFTLPLTVEAGGTAQVRLDYRITPPAIPNVPVTK